MILWNISPFSDEHPSSPEVYLVLLTDVSADPGEGLRVNVFVNLKIHSTNTPCYVIVTPEWCYKMPIVKSLSRKEVRGMVRKSLSKRYNSISRNLKWCSDQNYHEKQAKYYINGGLNAVSKRKIPTDMNWIRNRILQSGFQSCSISIQGEKW